MYLIETSGTLEEEDILKGLKDKLQTTRNDIDVKIGKPLEDPTALKEMAESDNIILSSDLRKTKLSVTDKYCDIFNRYDSNVLGAVVIARP